jgi:four helix bundle protein
MENSSNEKILSAEDLECWKSGNEVKMFVAEIIKKLPTEEKYDLIDNLKRASRSVTRNIAEGYGRFHYRENIQFCRTSRGSLYEILDDLITCEFERYISKDELKTVRLKINKALSLLNGYINYLNRKLNAKTKNLIDD